MNYKFKTQPYEHQLKALTMSWDKEYFAYFMEMGTGKSKVLIDNIAMLYDKGKINGALIVAPKGVVGTWYLNQIPDHLPNHIEHKNVLWKPNITRKQNLRLKSLFETGTDLHILIMNVEAFSTTKGCEFAKKFLDSHRTLMAVDESTTIKNPDAKRTKNICNLSILSKYRRILTGSPVTKSPLDLYKQCDFLKEELLGHGSYYTFRTRYAIMKTANFGGKSVQIVVGYRNLDELSEKLRPFSYRVLKDDCLDLPDKIYMKRSVQLSSEQKKVYEQMKQMALAEMNGKMMSTATVLTQLMRLHQITCGHFTADDGSIQKIKSNRLDELMDVLEEIEGKVVIWAHYQNDVETIVEHLKKKYGDNSIVDYYGRTRPENRQSNIDKFQKDEGCRFFIGTPATGGYGITLTQASNVIYYSNGYDLEKRMQSEDRAHRIGQKKSVTYVGEELKQWI